MSCSEGRKEVGLPPPRFFGEIELQPLESLAIAESDVKDFFLRLGTEESLSSYFALEPVQSKYLREALGEDAFRSVLFFWGI